MAEDEETHTGECVGGPHDGASLSGRGLRILGDKIIWPGFSMRALIDPHSPIPVVTEQVEYVWGEDDNRWHYREPNRRADA